MVLKMQRIAPFSDVGRGARRRRGGAMANMGNQKLKLLTLLRILERETDSEQGLSMPQIIERLEAAGIPYLAALGLDDLGLEAQ